MSASDFGTVSMRRWLHACTYEFLTTVTKVVVHRVCKDVILSSSVLYGDIRCGKVNEGCFSVTNVCSAVIPLLLTVKKTVPNQWPSACSVNNSDKMLRSGDGSAADKNFPHETTTFSVNGALRTLGDHACKNFLSM